MLIETSSTTGYCHVKSLTRAEENGRKREREKERERVKGKISYFILIIQNQLESTKMLLIQTAFILMFEKVLLEVKVE